MRQLRVRGGIVVLAALAAAGAAMGACFSSSSGGPPPVDGLDASFDSPSGDDVTADSPPAQGPDGAIDAPAESLADGPAAEAAVEASAEAGADAATDAPADAPAEAATDGPADATVEAAAVAFYVDPVNGLDTNPGSAALPFKTIYKATTAVSSGASDAGAPPTVYLADGTYDSTNQTSFWGTFSKPAFVVGSSASSVILSGTYAGEALYFAQGGGISGVTFHDSSTSFQVQGGTFNASGVVFDGLPGFNNATVSFVGAAVATMDTIGVVNMNTAGGQDIGTLLYADNNASVTWHASATTITSPATSPGMAIFGRGAARMAIDGLTLASYPGQPVVLYDQAQLTLTNSTITASGPASGICSGTGCRASIWLGGSQTGVPGGALVLSGTTISGSPGSAVGYTTTSNTGTVSLSFTNSHLDNNAYAGLWVGGASNAALALTVSATNTTFSGNAMSGITAGPRATLSLSGGAVSNNGAGANALGQTPGGVVVQDGASANSLTMRNVTLAGNTGNAIGFAGSASASLDLGTASSAGGNTFSGVPASSSALSLTALIAASAVGDTWMPNVQGSSAAGLYTSATTITGAATGQNVTVPAGASVVVK